MNFAAVWKAILAFVSLVVTNAIADWQAQGSPFPHSLGDVVRWVLTSLVGTVVVYLKANTTTDTARAAVSSVRLKNSKPRKTAKPAA